VAEDTSCARFPVSVRSPVPQTTAWPWPAVSSVPANARLRRSASTVSDRSDQDLNERLVELLEKLEPRRRAAPGGDAVRAKFVFCRRATSSAASPVATSTPSIRKTSAEWTWCQAFGAEPFIAIPFRLMVDES